MYIIGLIMLAVSATAGMLQFNRFVERTDKAGYDRRTAEDNAAKVVAATLRLREQQRLNTIAKEKDDETQLKIMAAETVAATERAAADKLRSALRKAKHGTGTGAGAPTTDGERQTASGVARISEECVTEYSALAEAARRGLIAGDAAVSKYESLNLKMTR